MSSTTASFMSSAPFMSTAPFRSKVAKPRRLKVVDKAKKLKKALAPIEEFYAEATAQMVNAKKKPKQDSQRPPSPDIDLPVYLDEHDQPIVLIRRRSHRRHKVDPVLTTDWHDNQAAESAAMMHELDEIQERKLALGAALVAKEARVLARRQAAMNRVPRPVRVLQNPMRGKDKVTMATRQKNWAKKSPLAGVSDPIMAAAPTSRVPPVSGSNLAIIEARTTGPPTRTKMKTDPTYIRT